MFFVCINNQNFECKDLLDFDRSLKGFLSKNMDKAFQEKKIILHFDFLLIKITAEFQTRQKRKTAATLTVHRTFNARNEYLKSTTQEAVYNSY